MLLAPSYAWSEFVPFLDYAPEIRRVIYSTNAIESLSARFRRATRAGGRFPNEQAAMKCLYLVVRSLSTPRAGLPSGRGHWSLLVRGSRVASESLRVDGVVVYDPIGVGPGTRDHLAAHPVALVAVTSRLRPPLAHLVLGSGAREIVDASTAPTLAIPAVKVDT